MEEIIMTNEQKRWDSLPNFDNETIKIWLDMLLESKGKMFLEELTIDEIKAEIEENKGSIENFKLLGDKHAILDCDNYIKFLEDLLPKKYLVTAIRDIDDTNNVEVAGVFDTIEQAYKAKDIISNWMENNELENFEVFVTPIILNNLSWYEINKNIS